MTTRNERRRKRRGDFADRFGKRLGIIRAGAQDMKSEPLRALGADAGQLAQLLDQPRHGFCES